MRAFDFESCLIQPAFKAPLPVCLALASPESSELVPSSGGLEHMRRAIREMLQAPLIAGFNLSFDVGIILEHFPEFIDDIFAAYDAGKFVCVAVAERLGEISVGAPAKYSNLDDLGTYYGLQSLDKANSPQKDYARFFGKELSEYPERHIAYPKQDASHTLKLWQRVRQRHSALVSMEAIRSESRHDLWLHLCASWGFRTDAVNLEDLRREAHARAAQLQQDAVANGFLRPDGSKDTKVIKSAVQSAYGNAAPLTKTGLKLLKSGGTPELKHVSTAKVALEDSGDPLLMAFADWGAWSAVINKDLDMLEFGLHHPIHTRYGMAATTRTTASGPNVQNFRRLAGVRECVVPRSGHCFGFIDVSGLELGTLAQVISWTLDSRNMCKLINAGTDLHLLAACRLRGWDYDTAKKRLEAGDPEVKEIRQFCKIANFGYAGFMGAKTLVPYARQQGVVITLSQAKDLRANWVRTLPEGERYLRWTKTQKNWKTGRYDFRIPGSPNILRAGATLASSANGRFQGLGAQGMKACGWEITKESWTDKSSPLYAVPMWIFIHDEFGFEIPIGEQGPVLQRADEIMVRELEKKMPDVRFKTEATASSLWAKGAKQVFEADGSLGIWTPEAA